MVLFHQGYHHRGPHYLRNRFDVWWRSRKRKLLCKASAYVFTRTMTLLVSDTGVTQDHLRKSQLIMVTVLSPDDGVSSSPSGMSLYRLLSLSSVLKSLLPLWVRPRTPGRRSLERSSVFSSGMFSFLVRKIVRLTTI